MYPEFIMLVIAQRVIRAEDGKSKQCHSIQRRHLGSPLSITLEYVPER